MLTLQGIGVSVGVIAVSVIGLTLMMASLQAALELRGVRVQWIDTLLDWAAFYLYLAMALVGLLILGVALSVIV